MEILSHFELQERPQTYHERDIISGVEPYSGDGRPAREQRQICTEDVSKGAQENAAATDSGESSHTATSERDVSEPMAIAPRCCAG